MNYRRLSLYLDKLQAYQVKRLALLEKWETADLLRVLIVLGMHEDFCSSYQHVSVIKGDWIIGTSQGSIRGWNYERPHQGIRCLYPADVYFHDRCG